MPPFEEMDLTQTAVLWERTGFNRLGRYTTDRANPVEISVRWITKRIGGKDAQGNKILLDALAVVNQEILVGSEMWLGELEEWLGSGSAGNADELMEVVSYHETPDIKGRFIRRVVGLVWKGDTPGSST